MGHNLFDSSINFGPSQQAYWDGQSVISGTDVGAAADDRQVEWSRLSMVFTRTTPTTITDDVAVTSIAYVQDTLDHGTSTITSGQKAAVEGHWNTMWGGQKSNFPAHWTLLEYRWHDYVTSWTKPGPAVRVTASNTVMTGSSVQIVPDQVASSITFITASRIHWGRMFFPGFVTGSYTSTGRIATAQCDAFLAAVRTCLLASSAAGHPPVVASSAHGATLGILKLQMDNTPDVIRSRRAKHPEYRKLYTS